MPHAARAALLSLMLLAVACTASTPASLWEVSTIESPAPVGSAQPQISVGGSRALVSWLERDGATATLRFSGRTAHGWSAPRAVASGDDWFVNWADVPSIVALADGTLAAHWLQKSGPGTYAYDVQLAFSKDDGITWSPSLTPHHDGTQTEHGFASLFQAPTGGLGLVWLDGRAMRPGEHGEHAGAMALRAATFDMDGRQIGEVEIDDRVCECCPTAAALTADGPIAAYRNRREDEVRDIYVSRLVNGTWTTPAVVHADDWRVAACPVNGPALSAHHRRVAVAWFTMAGGQGHTFVAFSNDSGATFGTPVRVDETAAIGRVDVELLDDGSAAVSWIEVAGEAAELRVRRVAADGIRGESVVVATLSSARSSGYPRMARLGNELLLAWTEAGERSQVRAAVIRLS